MDDALKVIYVAASLEQAHILKNALGDEGIEAYVSNKALQFAVGEIPMGWPTAARVVVHERDAEAARRIALEFDQAGHEAALALADEEFDTDGEAEPPWPCCPSCSRPRHTSCPVCETAGTDFPRAFLPDDEQTGGMHVADGEQGLLVLCPSCDEPFTPEFPARCEWCGHRFADGWEPPSPRSAEPSEFNLRVWITIAGLAITVLALIGFFAMLVAER